MIKTDFGHTHTEGSRLILMADLASIIETLSDTMSKEDIMIAVEAGFMSEEEIAAANKEARKRIIIELGNINELISKIIEEEGK